MCFLRRQRRRRPEKDTRLAMKKLKEHIDKAGIVGVLFSHLCCIGLGAQISLIAPAFSVFVMNNRVFLPFLFLSLVVSNLGLFLSYLKHKNIYPVVISFISSGMIIAFYFGKHIPILFYIGIGGLIGASVYNTAYSKKRCNGVN